MSLLKSTITKWHIFTPDFARRVSSINYSNILKNTVKKFLYCVKENPIPVWEVHGTCSDQVFNEAVRMEKFAFWNKISRISCFCIFSEN